LEADTSNWKQVAAGSGVPYSTIYKIGKRIVKDPGVSHIEKLARYFRSTRRTKAA
jgi:predicted transcriptional regulator